MFTYKFFHFHHVEHIINRNLKNNNFQFQERQQLATCNNRWQYVLQPICVQQPSYRSTSRLALVLSLGPTSLGSTDRFLKSYRYLRTDHVLSSRDGLSGSLILGTDRSSRVSPPANSPTPSGWFASRLRARSSSWWLYYRGRGMRTCWKNRDRQRYLSRAYLP